jgi:hypothetical protein
VATGTGNLPNDGMSFSPFAILTAEEMNDLVENIESLADGTGIGDGSVAADNIDFTTLKHSKIITATRIATDSSGNVAYTGVGFKPSKIHAIMSMNTNTNFWSHGFADSTKSGKSIFGAGSGNVSNSSTLVCYSNVSSWAQNASVSSFDDDGFTLSWTLIGSPTAGTLQVTFLCEYL